MLPHPMRAIVYERYGPPSVLEVRELATPSPEQGEVLVRVHAAALNPKDSFVRKGRFKQVTGLRFPRRLGSDFAGVVERVGPGVYGVRPGDEVFGMLNGWSGGAVAEYVVVPQDELAQKPLRLSFVEAAAVPLAALTALQALRNEGQVKAGSRVLLHGASGGVGTFAVQLAHALGADVTTTSSEGNLELLRGLGADETWDYRKRTGEGPQDGPWDCYFDIFGNRAFSKVRRRLTPQGQYVTTVPSARHVFDRVRTNWAERRARLVVVRSCRADLVFLAALCERGTLRPVVERVWPLEETAQAQAHVETKRTRGKVVVSL
jgi:NADPH:quinone reductase-like Zn-dependent oxidoreductase